MMAAARRTILSKMRHSLSVVMLVLLSWGCATVPHRAAPAAQEINQRKNSAHVLISEGRYEEAIETLLPLSSTGVKDSQLYVMLGESYWRLGAYEDAVANFEAALRLDYSDSVAHVKFAEMLMEMGKVGRALTEFELATTFGERAALPHYNYGLALYEFGRREEALAQWEMAYSLDDRDARFAEAVGIGYSGTDDSKAFEYFERAEELGAVSAAFHNNFGLLLTRIGAYARAASHLRAALGMEPANESYFYNLAVLHMKSGRHDKAVPLWESLAARSPDSRAYRIYLAKAYYEKGRFDGVVRLLEAWLDAESAGSNGAPRGSDARKGPGLNEAFDVLAMSFRALADLEKAAVYIGKALEIAPTSTVHLNNYGVILAENGKIAKAKAQWKKVLELDPENAAAKRNLSAFTR